MNIADIVVLSILGACMYFGWRKGLIVAVIEFTKWAVALVLARLFHTQFVTFVTKNIWDPSDMVSRHVRKYFYDFFSFDPVSGQSMTSAQIDSALEAMKLPPYFAEKLTQSIGERVVNNTIEFMDIVTTHVTNMVVSGLGFVALVILFLIVLGLVQYAGNLMAKLPLLKELNQGGGLIIGGMIGVLTVYFFMALIAFFPTFKWTVQSIVSVEQSQIAIYFFKYNLLQYTFQTVLVSGKLLI